jgi:hypothetical protein
MEAQLMQGDLVHMAGKLRSNCRIRRKVFNLNHKDTQYFQFESDTMLQTQATDAGYRHKLRCYRIE